TSRRSLLSMSCLLELSFQRGYLLGQVEQLAPLEGLAQNQFRSSVFCGWIAAVQVLFKGFHRHAVGGQGAGDSPFLQLLACLTVALLEGRNLEPFAKRFIVDAGRGRRRGEGRVLEQAGNGLFFFETQFVAVSPRHTPSPSRRSPQIPGCRP